MANPLRACLAKRLVRPVLMAMACVLCGGLFVVSPGQAHPPTPAQVAMAKKQMATYYGWINAPWAGDDQRYARLRQRIDREAVNGERAAALMRQYDRALTQHPDDLPTLFADDYAAYWASVLPGGITDDEAQQRLGNTYFLVIRRSAPHTYSLVRLVYLCQTYCWYDPKLSGVGVRLLQRDPSDYQVAFYTVSLLKVSPLPNERAQALTFAQDQVRRHPKKPNVYSLLASVHYEAWLRNKDPKEAQQALTGYQRYLELAPANYKFRKQAQAYIAQLEKS